MMGLDNNDWIKEKEMNERRRDACGKGYLLK